MERAKRILPILEMTNFQWDILTALRQPEQELGAIFQLKYIGDKMKAQGQARRKAANV